MTAKDQLEQLNQQIKEFVGIYHTAMTRSGISENEFWIWYALLIMGGDHAQQDLCGMWSLSKQTVNNIVTRMVQDGYVTLEVVPGTRNRKVIRLTEAGRAYGERLVTPISLGELRAYARISEEERNTCSMVLDKYIGFLREELADASAEKRTDDHT